MKGLTIIELVIVVAIIGILAALALPSHGDYRHRAQVSEAVALLGGAKTPLAEYFANQKKWPAQVPGETQGKYTQSVAISRGANGTGEIELTATMRTEGVDPRVAGKSVRMSSRDGGLTWACRPVTMDPRHVPSQCRPDSK